MINLDWLLGPRDWVVVRRYYGVIAAHSAVHQPKQSTLIRADLRKGAALRLARRLRQQDEC